MAGLCRILTTATVVVHLTVGCCAHHVLGCEGMVCPFHAPIPCGQSQECECEHSEYPQGNPGSRRSSVAPRRTTGDSDSPPFQAFLALPNDQANRLNIGLQQRLQATRLLLLPVRLHLANQVLLI
jgi:hypothetical protein